ncbi:hypothetical protein [Geotalea toluenoxydans]|uniref:hypothetical protein n=1 Tax=Geotalea toluenoxydans TaxID=421624 RepID=UPI0006D1C856|nr:hypothetical protein [Geotalea toluenoxydans]
MPNYAEMSKTLIQDKNPLELKRMQEEGILDEVLQEAQATFSHQEADIVREMTEDLSADLPYLQRVQAMNRAQSVAREIATADMAEFWQSIK